MQNIHSATGFTVKSRKIQDKDRTKAELLRDLAKLRKQIAGLKASQSGLRENEDALRRIRDFNPALLNTIGMSIVNPEGTILLMNKEMETVYGRKAIGNKCWQLYKDDKTRCKACPLNNGFCLGETDTVEIEGMFGGRTFQINHTGIIYKGEKAFLEIFQDITERKRYEAILSARAHQQAAVADLGQRALSGINVDDLFKETVGLVAQALGVKMVDILELLPDRNALLLRAGVGWRKGSINSATVPSGKGSHAGYTLHCREPVIVPDHSKETRFTTSPLLKEHKVDSGICVMIAGRHRPFGILGAHTKSKRVFTEDDIHFLQTVANVLAAAIERKHSEEELIRAQKLESVGILAGGISHDFNNLMTIVLGNISLAKLDINPENENYERLTEAEKAIIRSRDLTQKLLDFAQGAAIDKEAISISSLLSDSVCFVLTGSRIRCDLQVPDDLWMVEADERQMRQVFQNLTFNAEQAMPDGGDVTVKAENVHIRTEDSSALKEGRYVKVSIKDNGRGIPEKALPKIFDPYFTSQRLGPAKGLGLGLAITYSIIKNHKGYIDVSSRVKEGTLFTIYLPASVREAAAGKQNDRNRRKLW